MTSGGLPGRRGDLEGFVNHGWAQSKATAGHRLPCGEGHRPLQQQGACFLQRMCFRPGVCDDLGSDWVVFSPSCVKNIHPILNGLALNIDAHFTFLFNPTQIMTDRNSMSHCWNQKAVP